MDYKVVNHKGKEIITDVSLHPGEILEAELIARGLKKTEFATALGMRPGHFSELLHGKRHIGAYLALRLEHMLKIPAEYWMRVQVYYDLFEERKKELARKKQKIKV
jgi:antitoxin HigA-1